MEEYKKKYEAALSRAKEFMSNRGIKPDEDAFKYAKELSETIFPELRESEDERIRKWIISDLKDSIDSCAYCERTKPQALEAISWLEKQGEQKPEIEYIYPKFRIGDVIEPIKPNGYYPPVRVLSIEKKTKSYYCESDDKKHFSSIPIRCEDEYKFVEQKSAWSEEDENLYNLCVSGITTRYNDGLFTTSEYKQTKLWFQSLKNRVQPNHWKPSEEQICAFKTILDSYKIRVNDIVTDYAESLYNDIQKL